MTDLHIVFPIIGGVLIVAFVWGWTLSLIDQRIRERRIWRNVKRRIESEK